MPPFESVAYANASGPQNFFSKIMFYGRQYFSAITATLIVFALLTIFTSEEIVGPTSSVKGLRGGQFGGRAGSSHWGGAVHDGYFFPEDAALSPTTFRFAAVTDLDQLSKISDSDPNEPKFNSFLLPGTLTWDASTNSYSTQFDDVRQLISGHNEAGRGMELSELTLFANRLLAFDDRTGSIFEILSEGNEKSYVVPRFVITEGEGDTDKGMKWEWATVKDNKLHIGSMGKEYTKPDGTIVNTNNLWIATVDVNGNVERVDWTPNYNFVRNLLGAQAPGYVIHEAVLWSDHLKRWVFLPRRISNEKYDDVKDERKGSNKVVLVDESFTVGEIIDIKFNEMGMDPLHGFSTAAFVPGTKDRHVTAMRSVEEDCVGGDEDLCKQRSYMTVFDILTGDVLMEEVQIDQPIKYEGVEFVDVTRSA